MYTIQEFDNNKTKVMNYIMYKKRTEYEVRQKFYNVIEENMLEDIIEYVKQAGYLSDESYIERFIQECISLKNLSIKEIIYKLYQKGIKKDTLEDYLSNNIEVLEEYELKSANNIYRKKQTSLEHEEIIQYLRKKGYKEDTIKEIQMEE